VIKAREVTSVHVISPVAAHLAEHADAIDNMVERIADVGTEQGMTAVTGASG
jgi:hypothetical protein